jgi:hypothetical protein
MQKRTAITGLGAVAAAAAAVSASLMVTVVPAVSPDGTISQASAPVVIRTKEGSWTFTAPPDAAGDSPLLLNGSAGGTVASSAQVTNQKLYAFNKVTGHYSVRWAGAWYDIGATAPVEGTTAAQISFAKVVPQIADNSPAGAFVAQVVVTMSPASAVFSGALVSSNPFYTFRGSDVVLARGLSPADDGKHPTMITAVQ